MTDTKPERLTAEERRKVCLQRVQELLEGLREAERAGGMRRKDGLALIETLDGEFTRQFREAEEALREETQGPRAALEKLLEKLGQVESHPEYKSVWTLAYLHGQPYSGPTWEKEVQDARAALKEGN